MRPVAAVIVHFDGADDWCELFYDRGKAYRAYERAKRRDKDGSIRLDAEAGHWQATTDSRVHFARIINLDAVATQEQPGRTSWLNLTPSEVAELCSRHQISEKLVRTVAEYERSFLENPATRREARKRKYLPNWMRRFF
ncbi:MAG: hypothetical protein K2Y71_06165 [Xanthobacteraceae bacterium]|nr:hypothetical protein [Xanthobacteraceae bacterium]